MSKILSHSALAASGEMKAAITLGAVKIELAKITGITPAELILSGKKEAFAIDWVWPPDFPECWTGIFLFDNSMNVTKLIINNQANTYKRNWKIPVSSFPVPQALETHVPNAVTIWLGSVETIPAKIIIEIPLPIPFVEIWSPSHITNIEPANIITTI